MCGRFVWLAAFIFLTMAATTQAVVLTDNFDTPRNYLTQGLPGTIWDGFYGLGDGTDVGLENGETVDVLDANMTNTPSSGDANVGALYMQSTNSYWGVDFDEVKVGPLLYVDVTGDFTAIVRVVDYRGCWGSPVTYHNCGGIMARAPHLADAGAGEDFVSVEDFAIWGGNRLRSVSDDAESECDTGGGWCNAPQWLRLRRTGNVFNFDQSSNAIVWTSLPCSPFIRNDISSANVPVLQVGLFHCTFSPEMGYIAFENFELTGTRAPHPKAYASWPMSGKIEELPTITLWWKVGDGILPNGNEVYCDEDYSKVLGRTCTKHVRNDPNYTPAGLQLGKKYYWCVDTVTGGGTVAGDIWDFTVTASKAHDPDPLDGMPNIPLDIQGVKWTPGVLSNGQDFYFDADEAWVTTSSDPCVEDMAGDVNEAAIPAGWINNLQKGTNYYWRVDTNCSAYGIVKGDVWRFKTVYPFAICDNFEDWYDLSSGDMSGTIWDGIEGIDSVIALNANDTNAGKLYVETAGSVWEDNNKGFLLYKTLPSDFAASVQLYDFEGLYTGTYVDGHWPGLMARISDVDAAGPGEDWISIEVYNPQWEFGLRVRDINDGVTSNVGFIGGGFNAEKYFMMLRDGSVINIFKSFDGIEWTAFPGASPYIREDFAGQSLQIGICQSTPGSWSVWDDFCIGRELCEKAYGPAPADGGGMEMFKSTVSWTPGDYAEPDNTGHEVYFGTDYDDVNDADHSDPEYKGTGAGVVDGPDASGRYSYDAGALVIGQKYYWRIDEVNKTMPQTWKGDVWSFTVLDYAVIENFEKYSETGWVVVPPPPADTLRNTWIDGRYSTHFSPPHDATYKKGTSGSFIQTADDTSDGWTKNYAYYQPGNIYNGGSKAMKFYFDNDGTCTWDNTTDLHNYTTYTYTAPKFSEVCAAIDDAACLIPAYQESLGLKRDWRDFKLLKISFYGEPNNTITADDKLFVSLTDGSPLSSDPNNAAIYHPDYTRLKMPWWQDWYIPLADFTAKDPTLDLSDIARIHIGIGNMLTKPTGGKGCIFIDDIELLAFGVRMPCEVDLNGDGIVNFGEVALLANNWLQTGHGLTGDINNDNIVNLTDLETILIYWLQTCHQPPQPKISYPENGAVISNNSRVLITEYDESGEDDIIEVIMEYSGDGITWQPIDNAIDNSDEWLGTYETMWDTSELESGPYHLRTIMTDQTGQQGMDEIEILMNLAPVADFNINSYEIDYVNKITNINFSADSSYDPDGNIMNYKWDFGDGSYDYGQYVSHNYPFGSEYVIQLKTVDDLGTESLPKPKDIIVDANEGTPVLVITHDCGCKKLTVKTAGKATIDFPPPHAKKSGPNDLGENIEIDVTDGVNDGKLKFNFEIEAELDPKTNDLTKCTYGQKVKRTSRSDSKTINKKDAAGNEYPVSGANYGDDDYNIASTFQTVDARNIRWIDAPGYWDLNDSDIKATGAKWEAEFIAYVKGNLGNCERKFKITLEVDKNGKVIKSEFKILQ